MSRVDDCLKALNDSYVHSAEGDRCVMFAALYNKLQSPTIVQERTKRPDRTRVIHKILEKEFEIKGLPKWGATAVRGDLMDNKEHIRKFIDTVNALEQTEIRQAWQRCASAYKARMDQLYVPIELNPEDSLVDVIQGLVFKRSGGRVQQPLCFAVTKELYSCIGGDYRVETKKVFAGDWQSRALGDVQVFAADKQVCALEVKAHKVDNSKIAEVLNDHGKHEYSLLVLGEAFESDVGTRENMSMCFINDYVMSTLTHIAVLSGTDLETSAKRVLGRYNDVMINIEDKPDLSVSLIDNDS